MTSLWKPTCVTCESKCSYAEGVGSCFQHRFIYAFFTAFFLQVPFLPKGIWPRRNPFEYPRFGDASNSLTRKDVERFLGFAPKRGASRCLDGCIIPRHYERALQLYLSRHQARLQADAVSANVSVVEATLFRARRALHWYFDSVADKTSQRHAVGFGNPGCHVALHRRVGDTIGTERCLTDAAVLSAVKNAIRVITRPPTMYRRCNLSAGLTLHVFSDRNLWVPNFEASMAARRGNYNKELYARAKLQVAAIEHQTGSVVNAKPDPKLYLAREFPVGRFERLTFAYLEAWAAEQRITFMPHPDADLLVALYGLTHADAVITAPSQMSVRLKVLANADFGGFGFFDWCGDPVRWDRLGYYDLQAMHCYAPTFVQKYPEAVSHNRVAY